MKGKNRQQEESNDCAPLFSYAIILRKRIQHLGKEAQYDVKTSWHWNAGL